MRVRLNELEFRFHRRDVQASEKVMSDTDYLSLQASIICLLLFVLGTTAILERPEWFH